MKPTYRRWKKGAEIMSERSELTIDVMFAKQKWWEKQCKLYPDGHGKLYDSPVSDPFILFTHSLAAPSEPVRYSCSVLSLATHQKRFRKKERNVKKVFFWQKWLPEMSQTCTRVNNVEMLVYLCGNMLFISEQLLLYVR